jgi:hypothetical protein
MAKNGKLAPFVSTDLDGIEEHQFIFIIAHTDLE